jgi:hypothetical protein
MPTTMALRFRDLVASTVAEHQEVINKHGSVWWGWWSKLDERIPRYVFAHFLDLIRLNGSIEIFLVDSGSQQVYAAAGAACPADAFGAGEGDRDPRAAPPAAGAGALGRSSAASPG